MACHNWQLSQALEALGQGDAPQALAHLQRADRLDRAVMNGARSLMAQRVGAALFGRKLMVAQAVAEARPTDANALAALVALDAARHLERQHEWVRVEANYQRAAVDSLRESGCDGPEAVRPTERWLCRFTAPGLQPEYMSQLFAARWGAVRSVLRNAHDLPSALPALRQLFSDEQAIPPWQWVRHTVPTLLEHTALPAYQSYFEGPVDLHLAAEATRLWLSDPSRTWTDRASPALRERLRWADGQWQLTPWTRDSVGRMPLAWRAPG